jgi:hypothetical protein
MWIFRIGLVAVWLMLTGCAHQQPYDYTNFRAHPPRSILVLPPLNQSTAVEATYSYLSTVTQPLAELGYYVFPVALVDQYLKENGMPTAGEMHEIPLDKVHEVTGADSVLFITLEQYGSKYKVISTNVTVQAKARLVDTRSGVLIWEGQALAQSGSGGSGNLIADAIAAAIIQAIYSKTDPAHDVSRQANTLMFYTKDHGLLYGPYSAKYHKTN